MLTKVMSSSIHSPSPVHILLKGGATSSFDGIFSVNFIARSQLEDYRNKPGTNIGKPVFMDDPGNLLQVENRISFDTVLQ